MEKDPVACEAHTELPRLHTYRTMGANQTVKAAELNDTLETTSVLYWIKKWQAVR